MAARSLDETDRKLIALLRKDARAPVVALAKGVGLSRSAVQARLARLEDEGTIRGYTALLGGAHTPAVRAILLLRIETRPCAAVLKRFAGWPEIAACWSVAGPALDAVVLAETDSNEALGELRARLAEIPGIAQVTTAPILATAAERAGG